MFGWCIIGVFLTENERKEVDVHMELQILDWIQTLHRPFLDSCMVFITQLGNMGFVWFALALILCAFPKTRKVGILMMITMVLDVVLSEGLLKHIFQRVRPCNVNTAIPLLISRPKGYSFPSGHTSLSFAAVSILYFMHEKKASVLALILACLIAFSRLYLYVHYPTDVMAGIFVGVFCGYIIYKIKGVYLQ